MFLRGLSRGCPRPRQDDDRQEGPATIPPPFPRPFPPAMGPWKSERFNSPAANLSGAVSFMPPAVVPLARASVKFQVSTNWVGVLGAFGCLLGGVLFFVSSNLVKTYSPILVIWLNWVGEKKRKKKSRVRTMQENNINPYPAKT